MLVQHNINHHLAHDARIIWVVTVYTKAWLKARNQNKFRNVAVKRTLKFVFAFMTGVSKHLYYPQQPVAIPTEYVLLFFTILSKAIFVEFMSWAHSNVYYCICVCLSSHVLLDIQYTCVFVIWMCSLWRKRHRAWSNVWNNYKQNCRINASHFIKYVVLTLPTLFYCNYYFHSHHSLISE